MLTNRRQFLARVGAAAAAFAVARPARADDAPAAVSGEIRPELAPFDSLLAGFVAEHNVPGAALAVARNGRLVYARGFGYADVEQKQVVQPQSLFRIASISKPVTAVAILQLVQQKKLSLDDRLLDRIPLQPHLPEGKAMDERWKKITIRHLLHHTGGWDRGVSYDPISITPKIADALQTGYPVTPEHVCRYMMGQPLDFEPGERFAYSNLGYLLLGRVIEQITDEGYERWVKTHTLAPLGITTMQLGRALPEHRAKNEVRYYDSRNRTAPALYGSNIGRAVPVTYGGANLEAYEAHGGWIASATDLVRFAAAFDDPARCPILSPQTLELLWAPPPGLPGHTDDGKPKPTFYGCGWHVRPGTGKSPTLWHGGLIGGTSTLLVHRTDAINWAILFNADRTPGGKTLSSVIDPLLHKAANSVLVWPEGTALSS